MPTTSLKFSFNDEIISVVERIRVFASNRLASQVLSSDFRSAMLPFASTSLSSVVCSVSCVALSSVFVVAIVSLAAASSLCVVASSVSTRPFACSSSLYAIFLSFSSIVNFFISSLAAASSDFRAAYASPSFASLSALTWFSCDISEMLTLAAVKSSVSLDSSLCRVSIVSFALWSCVSVMVFATAIFSMFVRS